MLGTRLVWVRPSMGVGLILSVTLSHLVLAAAWAFPAWGQEAGGAPGTLAQQKLNPLAYSINLPATLSLGFGAWPHHDTQPTLNLQPRIPLGLTEDWGGEVGLGRRSHRPIPDRDRHGLGHGEVVRRADGGASLMCPSGLTRMPSPMISLIVPR